MSTSVTTERFLRRMRKPEPVTLVHFQAGKMKMTLEQYLGECVWCWPKWNEEAFGEAQVRIGEAFDKVKPGDELVLPLDDLEKLRDANNAAECKGVYAHKLRAMQVRLRTAIACAVRVEGGRKKR